ncbi:hypothetical protein [Olleya sp. R77988]|uniref:hypothetical protein n=1 Tax=Olleya sp. R77988 TaxID=3093875 RepID=UPI0037C965ED
MKYIIIYAEGFPDKIMIVDEPKHFDSQNRMSFFNKFYNIKNTKKGSLTTLETAKVLKLKEEISFYLQDSYRKRATKDITEKHHKVKKVFLDKEYELYVIEDRLAILGIDLYDINIYAKENNISIQYKTANSIKESSRLVLD